MNDEEFIKLAYEKGRVQDASSAFEDYPPEEEWHKGKIENVLSKEEYNKYLKNIENTTL